MKSFESTSGLGRLASLALVVAVLACSTDRASAQSETSEPVEVSLAERSAAIQRVLADRSRGASPLARATAATHRSLTISNELAHAAIEDLRTGLGTEESKALQTLVLESHNLRVAYEALQSGLAKRRVSVNRRAQATPRNGRSRKAEQRATTSRTAATPSADRSRTSDGPTSRSRGAQPAALDRVERVLELQGHLERSITDGSGRSAAKFLQEIHEETKRALQAIRRNSPRPSRLVHRTPPEIRREPIPIDVGEE